MQKRHLSKYCNPTKYLQRALRYGNQYFLNWFDCKLAPPFETLIPHTPVFILGAPRSGSTLLIQTLINAFNFGYITNRHCQLFGYPALADKLFHPIDKAESSNYLSQHGATKMYYEPSECGDWWYRFFRKSPAYVPLEDTDINKMRCMRRSIASITKVNGRPMLFKNLYQTLRLRPLIEYIPEALYLVIERNEIDNAHSILEGRKRIFGSYERWWSMEPPNVGELKKLPAHIQVVEQIRQIHTLIDNDIQESGIDSGRFYKISYEAFCHDVHSSLANIEKFLKNHNVNINRKNNVPQSFTVRKEIRIDIELYQQLKKYANS